MYHAGITPDGKPVHVARTDEERLRQHRILLPPEDKGATGAADALRGHKTKSCPGRCPTPARDPRSIKKKPARKKK
jgi:hypothetical protein